MSPGTSYERYSDEYFMHEALKEAIKSAEKEEIPVGAVIVCDNKILARAHNLTETLTDVTAHAEMQAFTAAATGLGGKYLTECTLFVTLEPCVMCAGAAFWTQIGRIVFGADDDKRGYRRTRHPLLHPGTEVTGGVLAEQCSALLKEFFRKRR